MEAAVSRGTFISTTGNIKNVNVSPTYFQISYAISLRATKCETSRTFVKELVLPSTIETASIKFNDNIASQITKSLFLTVVQKRLLEMTIDVTSQYVERMVQLDQIT
jgi:hypothetical protein